ncbi:DNA repair protein RadC [Pseudomonas putida]|jgi:DNA repair protein RadC|uniref:DNA repair protein RadC n=1 Tax=Pseudomonas putida TaxID=303 RepID=A0A0N8HH31_PSEPU|nr:MULTISPECIES: DNA repair protein RadC [Pseudomonas]KXK67825.1 DNA repair protein RadC [Pseudomonas monteilii]KPM68636.1 DNA repair protein RadC [Pseudomonas putida]MCS7747825.1 DNA repair protein RadC [Pseudomonas aeruginosa]MCS8000824.1 DNA repair protein RadC [Pseudomonas aeruginosa]MCS9648558.1 DNA repair protein RadC [Pseudomonas aeruginosa]
MKFQKIKAGEDVGSYVIRSPVTETEILRLALQLAARRMSKGKPLTDPLQVAEHLQMLLQDYEHEVFALLMLDTRHRVIAFEEVFRGTLDSAHIYPREVVKMALSHNSSAVILVHNHPSGDPTPSSEDRLITQTLQTALDLIGTRTLDHILVGREGYVSLAQLGWM